MTAWRMRAANALALRFGLMRRSMTLGARAAAFDTAGRVLLVRHTYTPGWLLPGGGVERGEAADAAAARELAEEGAVRLTAPLALFGLYWNRAGAGRDHVALFVARAVRQPHPKTPDLEIAEARFFPLDALPDDASRATRARLDEIAGRAPASAFW